MILTHFWRMLHLCKNQLPALSVSGTLVENGLRWKGRRRSRPNQISETWPLHIKLYFPHSLRNTHSMISSKKSSSYDPHKKLIWKIQCTSRRIWNCFAEYVVFKQKKSTWLKLKHWINISVFYLKFPASIYLFKVNNRNFGKRCEICSKSTIKIAERRHWRHSGVFIVNFEHASDLSLAFLMLALNK